MVLAAVGSIQEGLLLFEKLGVILQQGQKQEQEQAQKCVSRHASV